MLIGVLLDAEEDMDMVVICLSIHVFNLYYLSNLVIMAAIFHVDLL